MVVEFKATCTSISAYTKLNMENLIANSLVRHVLKAKKTNKKTLKPTMISQKIFSFFIY